MKAIQEFQGGTFKEGGKKSRFFTPAENEDAWKNRPPEDKNLGVNPPSWSETIDAIKAGLSRFGDKVMGKEPVKGK
jgi:hypothetical protein